MTDPGHVDGSGRAGASARVVRPAWLVYGQSFNRGWRATCDGRDLGTPVPLQGYANAWPLRAPGCRDLTLRFGPERAVHAALLVSAVGGALLLLLLLVAAFRTRGRRPEPPVLAPLADPDAGHGPMPLPRAVAWGVAVALAGGFVFALRAGVVLGPLVALLLARGVRVRPLVTIAGALLVVVVPLLYAAHVVVAGRPHAFDTTYATDRLAAHWVAVGAFALLALALVRLMQAARPRAQ